MSSSEFAWIAKLLNLHHFKLRLNKCLHKSLIFFETHKLRQLQSETQQMGSSDFAFV